MKIMLDAHGGDFGIETTVTGAIEAANDLKDDTIILIGPEKEIWNFLHEKFSFPDNIEIINATDNIEMHESPTLSIKKKVNSSIVKGFNYLKNDDVDAFVSCGNTGAVMTGAFTIVGRIKGIQRPAISTYFPTKSEYGFCLILDAGANVDVKPIGLYHFAQMGSIYAKYSMGINDPKIGLLSIGEEKSKGNEQVLKAYGLLEKSNLNFIGNIEGRDILRGKADVIICDGFVGNILIKFAEGIFELLMREVKDQIKGSFAAKIGTLFFIKVIRNIRNRFHYSEFGGAPLIGINKPVIIGHGISSSTAIRNAILLAKKYADSRIIEHIKERIEEFK